MLWEEMIAAYITLWQPVCGRYILRISDEFVAHVPLATSGACATIASDGLMNPFDGELPPIRLLAGLNRVG